MSPIPHGLQDVSECAHSEPNSPPKAGQGTSDGEVSIDDNEDSSRRTYMPFDKDLCVLSDHDSGVEDHTGARDQRVGLEGRSGPSKETKRAHVDLTRGLMQTYLGTYNTTFWPILTWPIG